MAKFDNPLNNLKIASPCSQDWDAMIGDNRKRYCGECKLNVFNLSGMSRTEAENLLLNAEGRVCVRYYKRADGSVITENCPVGWAKVKQRTRAYMTAMASLIFSFFGALGLVGAFSKSREATLMGSIAVSTTPTPKATPTDRPEFLMGAVAPSTPKPTPKRTPPPAMMGKVVVPKQDPEVTMGEMDMSRN